MPGRKPIRCADDQVFEYFESLRSGGVQQRRLRSYWDWRADVPALASAFEDEASGLLDRRWVRLGQAVLRIEAMR